MKAEWQPIETAPKDGSRILLATCFGTFIGQYGKIAPDGVFHDMFFIDGTFCAAYPTHWMPLPEPPK